MNKYQWYRKLRGGFWVYNPNLKWVKVDLNSFRAATNYRDTCEDWTK